MGQVALLGAFLVVPTPVSACTGNVDVKLTSDRAVADDFFGDAVSISGDRALVGAPREDDVGANSGSAYIFERDVDGSWVQVARLTAEDAAANDNFGGALSLSGDRAIVGASGNDDAGANSGSAYVFERDPTGSWSQVAKLTAADGESLDYFGSSVSLSGDYAIVLLRCAARSKDTPPSVRLVMVPPG